MSEVDYGSYSENVKEGNRYTEIKVVSQSKPVVKMVSSTITTSVSQESQISDELKAKLSILNINSDVYHKTFGKGTVVKINKNEKFIFIKFSLGEKKFIFPDAFVRGYLEI